jgi:hypothetical protein
MNEENSLENLIYKSMERIVIFGDIRYFFEFLKLEANFEYDRFGGRTYVTYMLYMMEDHFWVDFLKSKFVKTNQEKVLETIKKIREIILRVTR